MMRLSSVKALSWFAAGYVNLFRAVPLVMVLLWFFLIVPRIRRDSCSTFPPGTDLRLSFGDDAGFALFEAAYYSEIIRAGIQSVPKGQVSAASALGMTYAQGMRLVVLPQAFRNMVPLLLTQAIILFQDTSLVYVSALADFFGAAYKVGDRDGQTRRNAAFCRCRLFCHLLLRFAAREAPPEKISPGLMAPARRNPMIKITNVSKHYGRLQGAHRLHHLASARVKSSSSAARQVPANRR